jgi:O-acetyl-ADP-ribose deacetylase (regulator of RNase III)
VLDLAGNGDPIAVIETRARELVLRACDAGWSGPPYNPLTIADLLGIQVEANSEVPDARTVTCEHGLKIEFNPTRPRERVRFSIAHEIAHTLFSDVAQKTRHRARPERASDDWQLEMLCNLAAAEFVMPIGSLPSTGKVPKIEQLMVDRREFDVSAEAFLMRVAKTSTKPVIMFCASAVESGNAFSYRVDYSVSSKSSPTSNLSGSEVPPDSVVHSCTAIGQTDRAVENWATGKEARLECVGIPGFPGASLPRVAGIIHLDAQDAEPDPIKFVQGDVLTPPGSTMRVVCQLVNDQARAWGGGVARAAAKKFPTAQRDFSNWFIQVPRSARLGRVHFSTEQNDIVVASLIAQQGYGPSNSPRIRYAPLEQCLWSVAEFASVHNASVHLPRLGTGESGGRWETVEEIIRDTLVARDVRVTIYDLPPRRRRTEEAQLLI